MSTIKNAVAAILLAAKANPNITAASIRQECIDGDIGGWLSLPEVAACTLSEWTAAMKVAADTLDQPATANMAYASKMNKACRNLMGEALCNEVSKANAELRLAQALAQMNACFTEADKGNLCFEFPDMCFRLAARFDVKYEDLADAYDAQFEGA